MSENEKIIEKFYTAFKQSDYAAMNSFYHPDIEFSDAIFELKGSRLHAMWHMLLEKGGDPEARTFERIRTDGQSGRVHWEAKYKFHQTGRNIHNKVEAEFLFKDGKIIRHKDQYDLYQWLQMGLGPMGWLLGWMPFFQNKVKRTANKRLDSFIERHPQYESGRTGSR